MPFFWARATPWRLSFSDILTDPATRTARPPYKPWPGQIPGVYVPAAYRPDYHPDGTLSRFTAAPGFPEKITPPHLADLDAYPVHSRLLAPGSEFSHMFLLEVNRGCGRGCRFCAAGFIYRPLRHRSVASLADQLQVGLNSGAKIGLVGTAVTDHPDLKNLLAPDHRRRRAGGHKLHPGRLRRCRTLRPLKKRRRQKRGSGPGSR